jgi:hypothetical protein
LCDMFLVHCQYATNFSTHGLQRKVAIRKGLLPRPADLSKLIQRRAIRQDIAAPLLM